MERHHEPVTLTVTHTVLPLREEREGGGVKILAAKEMGALTHPPTPIITTILSATTELVWNPCLPPSEKCFSSWEGRVWGRDYIGTFILEIISRIDLWNVLQIIPGIDPRNVLQNTSMCSRDRASIQRWRFTTQSMRTRNDPVYTKIWLLAHLVFHKLVVCGFNYISDWFLRSKVLGINHDDDERNLLPCSVWQSW